MSGDDRQMPKPVDLTYEYPAEVVRQRAEENAAVQREREAAQARALAAEDLLREVLEALCTRDGLSLESDLDDGEPGPPLRNWARNYELAARLRIGHVFGLREP